MVAQGLVKNGVVVLENGTPLREGQRVTVLPVVDIHPQASCTPATRHSILDIPPVSLGAVVAQDDDRDDLLGEMLESRS